jgi:hypothetical protein
MKTIKNKKLPSTRKVSLEKVLRIMRDELTWETEAPHISRMIKRIKRLR